MNEVSQKQIKCPRCGHLTIYSQENPFRPFCSERCKIIDLGEWASESYKVPEKNTLEESVSTITPEDEDQF